MVSVDGGEACETVRFSQSHSLARGQRVEFYFHPQDNAADYRGNLRWVSAIVIVVYGIGALVLQQAWMWAAGLLLLLMLTTIIKKNQRDAARSTEPKLIIALTLEGIEFHKAGLHLKTLRCRSWGEITDIRSDGNRDIRIQFEQANPDEKASLARSGEMMTNPLHRWFTQSGACPLHCYADAGESTPMDVDQIVERILAFRRKNGV